MATRHKTIASVSASDKNKKVKTPSPPSIQTRSMLNDKERKKINQKEDKRDKPTKKAKPGQGQPAVTPPGSQTLVSTFFHTKRDNLEESKEDSDVGINVQEDEGEDSTNMHALTVRATSSSVDSQHDNGSQPFTYTLLPSCSLLTPTTMTNATTVQAGAPMQSTGTATTTTVAANAIISANSVTPINTTIGGSNSNTAFNHTEFTTKLLEYQRQMTKCLNEQSMFVPSGASSDPIAVAIKDQAPHPIFQSATMRTARSMQNLQQKESYSTKEVFSMLQRMNSTMNAVRDDTASIKKALLKSNQDVSKLARMQKEDRAAIVAVGEELDFYKDKVKLLTEAVHKLEGKMERQEEKIQDFDRERNSANLIVHGFKEQKEEDCQEKIDSFFKDKLKVGETLNIVSAHRMGKFRPKQTRPILVTLANRKDKGKIFGNLKNLKGIKAEAGKHYTVKDHLPKRQGEERKRFEQYKYINRTLPTTAQRLELSFKKGKMKVGEKLYDKPLTMPTTKFLVDLDFQDVEDLSQLPVATGLTKKVEDSTYKVCCAKPDEISQVPLLYAHMKLRFPSATHISMAYRFPGEDFTANQGYEDDGDYGNGHTLLNALLDSDQMNIVLFIVRYFGGTHLGPVRFEIISELAADILDRVAKGEPGCK